MILFAVVGVFLFAIWLSLQLAERSYMAEAYADHVVEICTERNPRNVYEPERQELAWATDQAIADGEARRMAGMWWDASERETAQEPCTYLVG